MSRLAALAQRSPIRLLTLAALLPLAAAGCGPNDDTTGAGGLGAADGGTGTGTGDGENQPPADAQVCAETKVAETVSRRPDVLLVVDKSGSMGSALDQNTNGTKWTIMSEAIKNLVTDRAGEARWGLMLFPWTGDCDRGQVLVDTGDDTAAGIVDRLANTGPNGNTPLHQSLREAREHYERQQSVNPDGRYVLVATDGIPRCSDDDDTVEEVEKLQAAGIRTFVLGFGSGAVNKDVLERVAVAGGTNEVYEATSTAGLQQAFDSISGQLRRLECRHQLDGRPGDLSELEVLVDGTTVDPADWTYDEPNMTIVFSGETCRRLEAGEVEQLTIDFGCGGIIVE